MIHPATEKQFEALKRRYPGAELRPLPSGACLVTLPHFQLPHGWSEAETTVRFIVPVGYPGPHPDSFWVTSGLRLAGGAVPRNIQEAYDIPETGERDLWFSWHIVEQQMNWNPNRDDLETFVAVIAERFRRLE